MDMVTDTATGMATARKPHVKQYSVVSARIVWCALACASTVVSAAEREFRIDPSITFRVQVVDRTPSDDNTARWLAEIQPNLSLQYNIGEVIAGLNYSPRFVISDADDRRTDVVQALNARTALGFASGRYNIGTNVFISETSRSALQPDLSPTTIPRDRTRTYGALLTASAKEDIAPGILGEAKASYSYNFSSNVGVGDSTDLRSDRVSASVNLKPSLRRPEFGWGTGADVSKRRLDGEDQPTSYRAFVAAIWNPSAALGGFVRPGYERAEYETQDRKNSGAFLDVGAEWRIGPRLEIRGELGKHFYGVTNTFNARLRQARSVWEFNAYRSLKNTQDGAFIPASDNTAALLDRYLSPTITDSNQRAQEVRRISDLFGLPPQLAQDRNFYIDQIVLEELVRLSAAFNYPRSTFLIGAQFRRQQPGRLDELSALRQAALATRSEYGLDTRLGYRLSPSMSAQWSILASRNKVSDSLGIAKRFRTDIGLTQEWSRAIRSGVTVFFDRQISDDSRADFSERGLNATLTISF